MSRQGRRSLRPGNADECGASAAWSNDSGTFGPPGGNTSRGRASFSFSPFQLEAQAAVVDAAPVGGVHVVASQANRAWIAACRSPRVAVSGIFTLRQDGGFCRHPSPRSGHGHPRPKCAYSLAINPGATDGKHAASQHGHHGRFAKKCHNHNTGLPAPRAFWPDEPRHRSEVTRRVLVPWLPRGPAGSRTWPPGRGHRRTQ